MEGRGKWFCLECSVPLNVLDYTGADSRNIFFHLSPHDVLQHMTSKSELQQIYNYRLLLVLKALYLGKRAQHVTITKWRLIENINPHRLITHSC